MHISKYTKLTNKIGKCYIYNSLSNFFAEIDMELFEYLNDKKIKQENVYQEELGDEIWNKFNEKKIFTDNENDDILIYSSIIKSQRRINNSLLLTITPTMDCNFFCSYCFETKQKGVMNDNTVQNIINWITNYKNIDYINITWFGGEPLLAPHIIKNITEGIKNLSSIPISASIITNGYFLTEKNIKLLDECGVKSVQVSIDGIYESHNKKRFTKTDKNTFDTILKNIDTFHSLHTDMKMTIRVGIDKDNRSKYNQIHEFFTKRYAGNENITIAPALIVETTKQNCNESCLTDIMEKYEFYKNFSIQTGNKYFIYPLNTISECAVRNLNSWAIDAKGDIYKCWEIIGNTDYKIGELNENGLQISNLKILNRYLYGADPFEDNECQNCFSLPICGGGCPHKRIENKFNNKEFSTCTYFNSNLEDFLLLRTQFNDLTIK